MVWIRFDLQFEVNRPSGRTIVTAITVTQTLDVIVTAVIKATVTGSRGVHASVTILDGVLHVVSGIEVVLRHQSVVMVCMVMAMMVSVLINAVGPGILPSCRHGRRTFKGRHYVF